MRLETGIATLLCAAALPVGAQSVDPKLLLNPPAERVAHLPRRLHRPAAQQADPDHAGERRSAQTGLEIPDRASSIKASPIVANGMIYITAPDNLWAIDARTGKEVWHHQHPKNNGFHIGHRGAAIYKDTVYLTTPDCHLVALNASNGKVKWNIIIADSEQGLLVHQRAADDAQSRDGRRLRRFRQSPRHAPVLRCRHRQAPVDVLQHAASRRDRAEQRRRDRRADVEDRHLRSGSESGVRRHRQSHAGAERRRASRRQSLDLQHRRPQSGHRQTGLGLSGVAARHARLGRRRSPGAGRWRLSTASPARC